MLEVQSSGNKEAPFFQVKSWTPNHRLLPPLFSSLPMTQQIQCLGQVLGTCKCLRVTGPREELVPLSEICL